MQGLSFDFCVVLEVYLNTPVLLSGPGLGQPVHFKNDTNLRFCCGRFCVWLTCFPKPFHTTPISSRRIKLIHVVRDQWVFIAGSNLVGGFNPVEKYARQIGSFPQVKVDIENIWNNHLDLVITSSYLMKSKVPASDGFRVDRTRMEDITKRTGFIKGVAHLLRGC